MLKVKVFSTADMAAIGRPMVFTECVSLYSSERKSLTIHLQVDDQ
jgi:hypothetical protein